MEHQARRQPSVVSDGTRRQQWLSYLLLELLVYRVQRVFDCDTFQVSRRHLKAKREVEIDLLHRWCCEHLLEYRRVINIVHRVIELPEELLDPTLDVFESGIPIQFLRLGSDLNSGSFLL